MNSRSFLAVILCLLAYETAHGQQSLTMNVFERVFPLVYGQSFGSSFNLDVDGRQYLITAKHVVAGIKDNDEVKIRNQNTWPSIRVKLIRCENADTDIIALVCHQEIINSRIGGISRS